MGGYYQTLPLYQFTPFCTQGYYITERDINNAIDSKNKMTKKIEQLEIPSTGKEVAFVVIAGIVAVIAGPILWKITPFLMILPYATFLGGYIGYSVFRSQQTHKMRDKSICFLQKQIKELQECKDVLASFSNFASSIISSSPTPDTILKVYDIYKRKINIEKEAGLLQQELAFRKNS